MPPSRHSPTPLLPLQWEYGRGGAMKWLLCLVVGHQKTLMAFSSNRFSCRRCGADLGRDVPATPSPPVAARTHPTPREADPLSSSLWERSLRVPLALTGKHR